MQSHLRKRGLFMIRLSSTLRSLLIFLALSVLVSCSNEGEDYDVIILNGTVYDGSGQAGVRADVGIRGDRIVAVGDLSDSSATNMIDAQGLAVAPGFINILSWGVEPLIVDGRGLSDIKQGVTLEVFGEGYSWGPFSDEMKKNFTEAQGDLKYDITWTTLGEYLDFLTKKGISPNVASYVGATTVRMYYLGEDDIDPSPKQLAAMQELVREAMREGALGVGSSLIYAPASFAETPELIALVGAAAEFGGGYISHMRSEGKFLLEAVEELITIARETGAHAEIYHLKAAGKSNWGKIENVFALVEAARSEGLAITADMYTYIAGATGLDAAMPTWVQAGGYKAWAERLKDPEIRARVIAEMRRADVDWENYFEGAGPDGMLLVGFKNPDLRKYIGKTLTEVAAERGISPADTALDLVIENGGDVGTVYFLMSEENVKKQIAQPWVSFGSDAEAMAPEGNFLLANPHPRAYGNFSRLLGKYVREEGVISLAEAIRRLTSLPAANIKIRDRGMLAPGFYADLAIFDPDLIQDHATFDKPHQLATGMVHVFVNGQQVLRDGEHTGATPGRVVRGPGWVGWTDQE